MPYASLQEVYGTNFHNNDNQKKIDYYTGLTPMKELNTYKIVKESDDYYNHIDSDDESDDDSNYEKILDNMEKDEKKKNIHEKFLNHFKKCKKCQKIIKKKLNINNNNDHIETFDNKNNNFDKFIIIILGIFLIFILDGVIKLAKYI